MRPPPRQIPLLLSIVSSLFLWRDTWLQRLEPWQELQCCNLPLPNPETLCQHQCRSKTRFEYELQNHELKSLPLPKPKTLCQHQYRSKTRYEYELIIHKLKNLPLPNPGNLYQHQHRSKTRFEYEVRIQCLFEYEKYFYWLACPAGPWEYIVEISYLITKSTSVDWKKNNPWCNMTKNDVKQYLNCLRYKLKTSQETVRIWQKTGQCMEKYHKYALSVVCEPEK